MNEDTLLLIKPDAVWAFGAISCMVQLCGIHFVHMGKRCLSPTEVILLWGHQAKGVRAQEFLAYLTSGPCIFLRCRGVQALSRMLYLKRHVFRPLLSRSPMQTAVHCSDSVEDAQRELEVLQI